MDKKLIVSELSRKEIKRIFSKISIDPITGCWIWHGSVDGSGYGLVWFRHHTERIHRVIFAWRIKPISRGIYARSADRIDHLCRRRNCCNPEHLESVTQRTNVLRGNSPIAFQIKRTHCIHGHILEKNRKGTRRDCRTCESIRHKRRMLGPDREYWLKKQRQATRRYYLKKQRNSQP